MAFRTLTFNDLIAWDRVLRAIWVGDRYITVVTDRDLATFWQRRLAILILVGIFNSLFNIGLFVFRQLGWVIDLHLVTRNLQFMLFGVGLAFDYFVPCNCCILGAIWVGDRYVTVVTDRDLRPIRQVRVRFVNLVLNGVLFIVR